jgi:hypothetical protein
MRRFDEARLAWIELGHKADLVKRIHTDTSKRA